MTLLETTATTRNGHRSYSVVYEPSFLAICLAGAAGGAPVAAVIVIAVLLGYL